MSYPRPELMTSLSADPPAIPRMSFPDGFLWGASTAAHQVEGGNTRNDWWDFEHKPDSGCAEPSGDACDSFERWHDDLELVRAMGLGSYRFSLEWSRVEPADGEWSIAALDHYRRICAACCSMGIAPFVTFHHFTTPRWLAERGGWESPEAPERFARFCEKAVAHLGDLIGWACTINEPNVIAANGYYMGAFPPGLKDQLDAAMTVTANLIAAHQRAVEVLRRGPGNFPIGLGLAMADMQSLEGGEEVLAFTREVLEDGYLRATVNDDYVGVQCYTRMRFGPAGVIDPPPGARLTDMGNEYWPQVTDVTIRRAAELTAKPVLVTENGISTSDDAERIAFITEALAGVRRCLDDSIDVRGYFYWSLLDSFEWNNGYRLRYGLVSVDRATFERRPKPSSVWFGRVARSNTCPPMDRPVAGSARPAASPLSRG